MAENTHNPVVVVQPNTSGLSDEKQKRYLERIRSLAISEVVLGILLGIFGIAAAVYSLIHTGTCIYLYRYIHAGCSYRYYPSFGVGLWSSVLTVVAGVLGICSTGVNLIRKCRIIAHIVVAIMALFGELITGCGAAVIADRRRYAYGDDYVYVGMMITIAVTSFIKLFLLGMSVRQSFLLLPNCDCDCVEEMNPPSNVMYVQTSGGQNQGGVGVVMMQSGVYSYPQTGVMMQPQGGTMMMTPQGTMMMQPGYQMQPGMMHPQTTNVLPPATAGSTAATAPSSAVYSATQPPPPAYYPVQPTYAAQVEEKKPTGS